MKMRESAQSPGGNRRLGNENAYLAEKARQGYIALSTPRRKWLFFGALVLMVLVVLLLRFAA